MDPQRKPEETAQGGASTRPQTEAAVGVADNAARQKSIFRWRHAATLISVLAFVLSLATAAISAYTAYKKDIHDQQAQLATIVEKILQIPIAEAQATANAPRPLPVSAQDSFTSQMRMLTREGYSLARELGSNARTPELMAIANSLQWFENYDAAKDVWQQAVNVAENFSDEISALRGWGYAKIVWPGGNTDVEEAEKIHELAIGIGSKYKYINRNPEELAYTNVLTELTWINAWANKDCRRAGQYLQSADKYAKGMASGPMFDPYRSDISSWVEALKHCDNFNKLPVEFFPARTPMAPQSTGGSSGNDVQPAPSVVPRKQGAPPTATRRP